MRLALYFLLIANITVAGLGWLDYRKVKWEPSYSVQEGVSKLILLSDSIGVGSESDECWLLGPFADRDTASKLRSKLVYIDYQIALVEKSIQKAPGYWVYFGPLETAQLARQKLGEFKSKGIDSFLITKPELKNAVSLGVFENIDSAKRMIELIRARGYESKMTEISKQELQFWLSLSIPPSERLRAAFDQFFEGQNERLEARQIFCK